LLAPRVSVQSMVHLRRNLMTPYRVTAQPPREAIDVDVLRFAARTCRARRAQRTTVLGALALSSAVCVMVVATLLSRGPSQARASMPMSAAVPFDSKPMMLPPVHAIATTYCPFWGVDPVDTAARLQYELDHWVTCQNGCIPFPEPSPWD
jgi:hypothetical protein